MNASLLAPVVRCAHVSRLALPALLALVIAVGLITSPACAGVIHDESIDGDLSGDGLNPTAFTLSLGVNSIIATSVAGDREYVALTVPTGMQLSQIFLVSYVGDDDIAFIGVQAGDQLTEPPVGADPANLLGWTHFGPGHGNVGLDVLPEIAMGPGAIGFTPPLGEGVYTFWMQQAGENATTYQFDFIVVPGPGGMALLAVAALTRRRRRR